MVVRKEVTHLITLGEVEYIEQSAKTKNLDYQVTGGRD